MSLLSRDIKSLLLVILILVIPFVVGFVGVLGAFAWLIVPVSTPDTRWWDVLHVGLHGLVYAFLGGFACCAVAGLIMLRIQYWCGHIRCPYCDRPRKSPDALCDCPGAKAFRESCRCPYCDRPVPPDGKLCDCPGSQTYNRRD